MKCDLLRGECEDSVFTLSVIGVVFYLWLHLVFLDVDVSLSVTVTLLLTLRQSLRSFSLVRDLKYMTMCVQCVNATRCTMYIQVYILVNTMYTNLHKCTNVRSCYTDVHVHIQVYTIVTQAYTCIYIEVCILARQVYKYTYICTNLLNKSTCSRISVHTCVHTCTYKCAYLLHKCTVGREVYSFAPCHP